MGSYPFFEGFSTLSKGLFKGFLSFCSGLLKDSYFFFAKKEGQHCALWPVHVGRAGPGHAGPNTCTVLQGRSQGMKQTCQYYGQARPPAKSAWASAVDSHCDELFCV